MRSLALLPGLLFFLVACAGPQAAPATGDEPVSLSLEIRGKTWWTWRIDRDSIKGNGVNLQREGDVFFGFVGDEQVRLRRIEDDGREWLGTPESNLKVQRREGAVVMAGRIFELRHGAGWDGGVLLLSNPRVNLGLKREADGKALADPEHELRIVFTGGDPDVLLRRTEILWLLLRKVLPEAKDALIDPPRALP